ncbi:hypothetical protein OM280_18260 [Escherichia albertii]|nr:hypothetical protein [Escherichia albertii]
MSLVEWTYKLTKGNSHEVLSEGTKKWAWSKGSKTLNFEYPYQWSWSVHYSNTFGTVLEDSLPQFRVNSYMYPGRKDVGNYKPGCSTGSWGGFWGNGTTWSKMELNFEMMEDEPVVNVLEDCGEWISGIKMTTITTTSTGNQPRRHLTYNSVFRFKTATPKPKINIEVNPSIINMVCTISKDCITKSNLIITNPSSWSGKVYVTYPTVEGVNYNYYGNWVSKIVEVHAIEANTSPTFTQTIKLSGKKPGFNIFSIPIQVELV